MALTYAADVSESRLQKNISAMMPLQANKFYSSIVLSEPKIELIEDSEPLSVVLQFEFETLKRIKGTGRIKITGSIRYKPEIHAFFFYNITIIQLEIDNISAEKISLVKSTIQLFINKILAKRPVYVLKDDDLKHKLAKSMLQSVTVKDKKLMLELNVF